MAWQRGCCLTFSAGLVNGFVIAKLKINARRITTLATMQIVRGLAYIISDGKAVGIEMEPLPWSTLTGSVCLRQSGSPSRV
ncbi:hypothetical protein ACLB1Q_02475 [Escherichia coli]